MSAPRTIHVVSHAPTDPGATDHRPVHSRSSETAGEVPPLVAALEAARPCCLQPLAFFVSWQGVLTLAYSGFPPALLGLKAAVDAAAPALPAESPGSRWPKTSLACLRDGRRLTPDQLATLSAICREEGAALAGQHLRVSVDSAAVAIYECRCLERMVSCHHVAFGSGPLDESAPAPEEEARIRALVAEAEGPDYWFLASRDGNRESHYRGPHMGATLMHPLGPLTFGASELPGGEAPRPGLLARGERELSDRRRLLEAAARLRRRVEAALPGYYAFFEESSLHITLRALIN